MNRRTIIGILLFILIGLSSCIGTTPQSNFATIESDSTFIESSIQKDGQQESACDEQAPSFSEYDLDYDGENEQYTLLNYDLMLYSKGDLVSVINYYSSEGGNVYFATNNDGNRRIVVHTYMPYISPVYHQSVQIYQWNGTSMELVEEYRYLDGYRDGDKLYDGYHDYDGNPIDDPLTDYIIDKTVTAFN